MGDEVIQEDTPSRPSENRDVVHFEPARQPNIGTEQYETLFENEHQSKLEKVKADKEKFLNTLKKYHSFLDITSVSKRDLSRRGDKLLAVNNAKIRDKVKQ